MREPDAQSEHSIETYKSLIHLGTFGLKFVQLANGGGAIAILAYLGDVTSSGKSAPDLTYPMASFITGLVLGGVAILTAYFTQLRLYNEAPGAHRRGGHVRLLYASIGLVVLSLAAFAVGSMCAVAAFGAADAAI